MQVKHGLKAILAVAIFVTNSADARGRQPSSIESQTLVKKWVTSSQRLVSFHTTWLVGSEAHDREGNLVDSFDIRETCEFRWPIEMLVESRAVLQGDRQDSARSLQFDRESRIDSVGKHTETPLRVSGGRVLGENSLRGIVGSQSHRAPHLLGLWLAEHPEAIASAQNNADNTISLVLEPLRLRLTLASFRTPDNVTHPVVSKLELIDDDQNPLLWWVYDDFRQIGSTEHYTGWFRIQYSILEGSLYESPPSRIEEIGLLERRVSESVETELIAPSGDISSHEISNGEQSKDVPQQRYRMRKIMRNAPNILTGVGLLIIVVLGVRFIIRAKSQS